MFNEMPESSKGGSCQIDAAVKQIFRYFLCTSNEDEVEVGEVAPG